jgi:hypothetical protein
MRSMRVMACAAKNALGPEHESDRGDRFSSSSASVQVGREQPSVAQSQEHVADAFCVVGGLVLSAALPEDAPPAR